MNVTDDVLHDLLTIYLAGEASADTRALIEAQARRDPAFAAKMQAARELDAAAAEAVDMPGKLAPSPDGELRTLARTRQTISLRTLFFAYAVIFTTMPLLFLAPQRLHPGIMRGFCYLAAIGWVGCWFTHRQVRKAGL